jgi:manganese-dependent inorganic pyrophosphatase
LAEIAGIADVEAYAKEMFVAGSELGSKTEKEILYLDFKKFESGNTTFGVGQVTSMSGEELMELKPRMQQYMEESFAEHGADMIFLMLTDIMDESTDLIFCGEGAKEAVEKAFTSDAADRTYLKGCMSRKKQVVPQLTDALK